MSVAQEPLPIERKLVAGLLAAALLLIAAVGSSVAIKLSADRVEAQGVASLTRSRELDRALISLLDAERRQRDFMVTGRDADLPPYLGARIRAAKSFVTLRYLYADDAGTLKQIDALATLVQHHLAQLDEANDAAIAEGEAAARRIALQDSGRETLRQIENQLAALKTAEGDRHDRLTRMVDQRRTVLVRVEVLVLGLMLLTGGIFARSLLVQARQRQALARQLAQLALHDPLTGLPNRRQLGDELARAVARADRRGEPLAVLFVDLDGFKHVNDELGHANGDALLREVAQRFAGTLRRGDFLARLGGDEFAVLAEESRDEGALHLGERLIEVLDLPLLPRHPAYRVGASIGVAFYPRDAATPAELLACADRAMYEAKRAGKGTVRLAQAAANPQPPAAAGAYSGAAEH
jgi:diguanylate cyclase (GGDEF)-like protein